MAFYLIGLGMNEKSLTAEALEVLKKCDKIYLENYTVDFPYEKNILEKKYGFEINELKRESVEDESILSESKNSEVALLVYGDCLSATTHTQLILSCKKQEIDYKLFHNASIMTLIAATGLQAYKFGKTASMPNWKEHTNKPTSFMNYIKQNLSIDAHTLLLTDIGLELSDAIKQLEESSKISKTNIPKKIIVFSNAGNEKQKIYYDNPGSLRELRIKMPYCIIIPSNLHFIEEEALNEFSLELTNKLKKRGVIFR